MPSLHHNSMPHPLEESLRRAGSTYQPAAPEELPRIIAAFNAFDSEVEVAVDGCEIVRIIAGHINTTFGLRHAASGLAYIIQRMNTIFDLDAIANNLRLLEEAQDANAALLPDHWQTVSYLNARDTGAKIWYDGAGAGWRVMRYVPGEIRIFNNFGLVPAKMKAAVARSQGEAIAVFGRMLEAVPEERWREPLPNFHNTRYHLDYLDAILRGERVPLSLCRDACREVTAQPAFLRAHATRIDALRAKIDGWRALAGSLDALGHAVTHGDTKINNFVFRAGEDGELRCVCLIDLDTVQVGNRLDDLGDALRSAGTPAGEEPPSIDDVAIDAEIVENLIDGYRSQTRAFHGAARADALCARAREAYRQFLYSQCVRFFADALVGNAYFALKPGLPDDINLYRAEVQMRAMELLAPGA